MKIIRSEWPLCYYEEEDREIRKQLLEEHIASEPGCEADRIRLKLWEVRYAPRPKEMPVVDYFIKSFLALLTEAKISINIFNMKRELKNMDILMKDLCLRNSALFNRNDFADQALLNQMLTCEYQAAASFYFHFSLKDRKYGSVLMGTLSMKEEQVIEKLAGDLKCACVFTPKNFGLETEFQPFQEACFCAFCDEFPEQARYLDVK